MMDNSLSPPPSARDLLTSDELRRAQKKIANLTNRSFTWTNLSNFTAKTTLIVFFTIWFGSFWWMFEPSFGIYTNPLRVVPSELLYGLISSVITFGLALACTTVPAIFWSSLIAQTPAAELMNKMYAKYGRSGYVTAIFGAVLFTYLGFRVFSDFLAAKDRIAIGGPSYVAFWAIVCVFLAVVFPAWALNKTTPEQWISGMVQAREVARLQHAMQLEDMIGAAMIARMDALLHADLMAMSYEEQMLNQRERAAIVAATERRVNKAFARIGHTFLSLHGMALNVQTSDDDQIVRGYAQLAEIFTDAARETNKPATSYESYVESLPEVAPPPQTAPAVQAPVRQSSAVSERLSAAATRQNAEKELLARELERSVTPIADGPTVRMSASQRQAEPVTASQSVSQSGDSQRLARPSRWPDAYLVCRETLTVPFSVQELAAAANVSYSTADRYRKAWLEGRYLTATDVDGKYFWDDPE